jgi:molybdopterin converting factor small subunit
VEAHSDDDPSARALRDTFSEFTDWFPSLRPIKSLASFPIRLRPGQVNAPSCSTSLSSAVRQNAEKVTDEQLTKQQRKKAAIDALAEMAPPEIEELQEMKEEAMNLIVRAGESIKTAPPEISETDP